MDLEQYKQTWQNQTEEENKLSQIDIYKMTHKKSSSIVKWIFIIGVIEFCLLALFSFFNRPNYNELTTINSFLSVSEIISFGIIIYFLIQFYKNFKSISVSDNTITLMEKIKRTRKSVKNYVFINLCLSGLIMFIVSTSFLFSEKFQNFDTQKYVISIIIIIIIITIVLVVFWLIYQLLYGILLKKLNKNYKELANLDESN